MSRIACLAIGSLLLFACTEGLEARRCARDGDCLQDRKPGYCLQSPVSAERWCAFEDATCVTDRRWGILSGDGLADKCLLTVAVADGGVPDGPTSMAADASTAEPDGTASTIDATVFTADGRESPDAATADAMSGTVHLESTRLTYDFGGVVLGDNATIDFTITNTGTRTSSSIEIVATGVGFSRASSGTSDCEGLELAPGSTCQVRARFSPEGTAATSGKATVGADGAIVEVSLFGHGLTPGTLTLSSATSFGSLAIGSTTSAKIVTVMNTGESPSGPITASLADSTHFQILSSNCSTSLPPAGSCSISIQFKPTAVGGKSTALLVSSTSAGSTSGQLAGTGTATLMVMRGGCEDAGCGRVSAVGIDCGSDCTEIYSTPSVVLSALPDNCASVSPAVPCWSFTGWSGGCTGAGTCTVSMDAATKTVVATFARTRYTLKLNVFTPVAWSAGFSGGIYDAAGNLLCAVASPATNSTTTCVVAFSPGTAVSAHGCANWIDLPILDAVCDFNGPYPAVGSGSVCGPSSSACPASLDPPSNPLMCAFTLVEDETLNATMYPQAFSP